ncbi:ABC-F family ATP-binding cassette domain-containing protein [Ovoidimarina sediminis]|uniref:ABC-F family ATP-binding cassette domain-containing protein n=1 Tax=Ovoidimarina sediminis TaxID=3079856 RepID=UPI002906EF66|nr:ATP-binding cassette domain-containing protein [Rhodophyticola sp. MJ-SS7]MDU8946079.1 ATP-binding cassette domain-containing protein [Rhodophyticola sp. MJ-SS7]
MARAPLLQLSGIGLTFGGTPQFEGVDLVVQPGDRIALVGRNGSGKSTLLKIMAGLVQPDTGERTVPQGFSVGYMEQEPDMAGFDTLGAFAASGLAPEEAYRVEAAAEGLKFDPATPVASASGGERRRAALAKIMAEAPDLLLLDEPTNHLDIDAIRWLEETLANGASAFVIISHDRAVLRRLATATLWLDRGVIRRMDKGFDAFEDWRDTVWEEEDTARHKLDRKIKAESRWAVEGISARRKRNQGRVRALQNLRAERKSQIQRQGTAAMALEAGPRSGRLVAELEGVAHGFGDRTLFRDVSLRLMRGDRLALVGPNGVGKTTLLKIITGELAPDAGRVRLGTGLEMAVFDQTRSALDPDQSLWDSLTGSPEMRVSGRADQVMVRGTPRHVVGYLKDFLFTEAQARAPVRSLSGGEKARLLLARLMAKPSNLLVLDEPTNDLDLETLDLLQELIGEYDGTVIVVSHDRDFIDRMASVTLALEGDGRAALYPGGWSDYQSQRGPAREAPRDAKPKARNTAPDRPEKPAAKPRGLTFTERHRLEELPGLIDRLEAEIAKLSGLLSDPDLYTREPAKFAKATEALTERQARLSAAEEEWLTLAEKSEAG